MTNEVRREVESGGDAGCCSQSEFRTRYRRRKGRGTRIARRLRYHRGLSERLSSTPRLRPRKPRTYTSRGTSPVSSRFNSCASSSTGTSSATALSYLRARVLPRHHEARLLRHAAAHLGPAGLQGRSGLVAGHARVPPSVPVSTNVRPASAWGSCLARDRRPRRPCVTPRRAQPLDDRPRCPACARTATSPWATFGPTPSTPASSSSPAAASASDGRDRPPPMSLGRGLAHVPDAQPEQRARRTSGPAAASMAATSFFATVCPRRTGSPVGLFTRPMSKQRQLRLVRKRVVVGHVGQAPALHQARDDLLAHAVDVEGPAARPVQKPLQAPAPGSRWRCSGRPPRPPRAPRG